MVWSVMPALLLQPLVMHTSLQSDSHPTILISNFLSKTGQKRILYVCSWLGNGKRKRKKGDHIKQVLC